MNQKAMPAGRQGFSPVILLGIIAVLILVGTGGFLVLREKETPSSEKTVREEASSQKTEGETQLPETPSIQPPKPKTQPELKLRSAPPAAVPITTPSTAPAPPQRIFQESDPASPLRPRSINQDSIIYKDPPSCGAEKEFFTKSPASLSDFRFIRPLGFIGAAPEHIYPTDHVYFFLKRGASNNPIGIPVYSPGDVWITRIKEIKMERPVPNSTDYSIYFTPCKEFEAFYFHLSTVSDKIKSEIKPPYKYCNDEGEFGRFKSTECEKEVRIKLSEGELMGTVGQLDWQYSFDLGAYDLRTPSLDYANPSRWQKWQQHIVCPFDYFSENVKRELKARLGEDAGGGNVFLRTIEPVCGEIEQDELGTAQGIWFVKGEKRMYARPELSLIHDFIDPSIGAFAFGFLPTESGLSPDILHFNPRNSGLVNRDFNHVTNDGKIYCYDSLIKQWSYDKKPESIIVLIQLTNPTTLRIEGNEATSCGNGPWSFDKFAEFER